MKPFHGKKEKLRPTKLARQKPANLLFGKKEEENVNQPTIKSLSNTIPYIEINMITETVVFSLAAFIGNLGVAITGECGSEVRFESPNGRSHH